MFGAFLHESRRDADGNLRHADRVDVNANRAFDARELLLRCDFVLHELLEDNPSFALAADHTEKRERPLNPVFQHERVVLMAARDDEPERGSLRWQFAKQLLPCIDTETCGTRKILRVGERRAVIEDRHIEAELDSDWSDGLRDVPGAGNPKRTGWRCRFAIEPN